MKKFWVFLSAMFFVSLFTVTNASASIVNVDFDSLSIGPISASGYDVGDVHIWSNSAADVFGDGSGHGNTIGFGFGGVVFDFKKPASEVWLTISANNSYAQVEADGSSNNASFFFDFTQNGQYHGKHTFQISGIGDISQVRVSGAETSVYDLKYTPAPVPVPAAIWFMGSGLLGLLGIRRRRR